MSVASLHIPLDDVPERAPLPIALDLGEDDLRPDGVESAGLVRATLQGQLRRVDSDVLFEGTLDAAFRRECDRCLIPVEPEVQVPLTLLFSAAPIEVATETDEEPDGDSEDSSDGIYPVRRGELDLRNPVWEELVLATPSKVHCSPDCKGLCPSCGKNLNEGPCGCGDTPAAPEAEKREGAFDRLREMLPDLPGGDQPERK